MFLNNVQEVDLDDSGYLDFVEFLQLLVKRQREAFTQQELKEIFKVRVLHVKVSSPFHYAFDFSKSY